MPRPSSSCFIKEVFILIYFLETLCTHVGLTEINNKDFGVPGDYLEEEPSITLSQSFSKDQTFSYQHEEETITVLGSPIKFDPPNLTFKDQPAGVPHLAKVRIFNINSHSSIQMLSISGNTVQFHCSFFSDKVIPPGGNTTFEVVFLGRDSGVVENTLYIHTSAGSFRYNVEGESAPSPYRLRPLVGVKMPVNSSFSPVINLYNPYPTTIQVLEMHSSGGDLHLELPPQSGQPDNQVWEIPPYHTKEVMRANFRGRVESNNTAYIRIKTNSTDGEYLYVPLEIEVSAVPGLYATQDVINFGRMPSEGGEVSMPISLLNSGSRPITVTSIVSNPITDALSIDFPSTTVKVSPSTTKPTLVATASYNPNLDLGKEGVHRGKFIVKAKNIATRLVIPWTVEVLAGSLAVNMSVSKFLVNDHTEADDPSQGPFLSPTRPLTVTNRFSVPLAVHSALLAPDAGSVFTLTKFKPKVIKPGDTVSLARIGLKQEFRSGTGTNMDTFVTLHTNLTSVTVPLTLFNGNLQSFLPSAPDESLLDFGTVGMNEKKEMYFALINKGPVKVVLRGWGGNITGSLIELMGVAPGDQQDILARTNFSSLARRLYVPPHHYVVYRIGLMTGKVEGEMWASVFVSTEFQDLVVPFRFLVAKGSLTSVPEEINLGTNFPGRSSEVSLYVRSTFKHQMKVEGISVVGNDPRFSFHVPDSATILAGETSLIGDVVFDPGVVCRAEENCYTGFNIDDKFGHPWYLGLALPLNLGEMDLSTVLILWSRMRMATATHSQFNVTLRLDTNEVKGFHFNAKAALSWPILCLDALRRFPLTQLGNSTREDILLINPSQLPVLVHIVPLSSYPNPTDILANLPNRIKYEDEVEIFPDPEDTDTFRIESVVDAYDPFAPVATFGDDFSDKFDIGVAPNTYPIVLAPNQAVKVSILFTPKVAAVPLSSVLFIRNNLTGLQTVDLVGRGAVGDLKFGNKRSGSSIHAFDVTEKHLKDCDKDLGIARNQPGLTVKRQFTARNTGEVPIWVTSFIIDGYNCEGYGFKVLDCDPFELTANASRRINIAFTPDFTLSKITRTLTLKTSLGGGHEDKGDIKYMLTATVPPHLLSVCAKSVPRPAWEFYLYIMVITLAILTLLSAFVAAVVESDRILRYCYIMSTHATANNHGAVATCTSNSLPENARLLDLREVARQTIQECKERERSHSPSMILRKRKSAKSTQPEQHPSSSSLTLAASQILNDLNNTHNHQPTTHQVAAASSSAASDALPPPPKSEAAVIFPKGIIGFLCDLFRPQHYKQQPSSTSPSYKRSTSKTTAVGSKDDIDDDSSLQPSATSSKASTPQIKKKSLSAAASCPGNLISSRKTNKKAAGGHLLTGSKDVNNQVQHVTSTEPAVYRKPKPKISAQSSVNDECESTASSSSGSCTDNSSTAEDFVVVNTSSAGKDQGEVSEVAPVTCQEPVSGKKKKKKNKVDDSLVSAKEVKQQSNTNTALKPKKKDKSGDQRINSNSPTTIDTSRKEGKDKTPISSSSTTPRSSTPATPPPTTITTTKKQEAKVRGVPKDSGASSANNGLRCNSGSPSIGEQQQLRRQQSLPTYEKPPRLQQSSVTRMESYSAVYGRSTPPHHQENTPANNSGGFPASQQPPTTRAEPPRAIIFPEPKREAPVNQFGAIGCKVPVQQQMVPQNQMNPQAAGINNWSKVGGGNSNQATSNQETSELGLTPASLTNSLPGLIPGAGATSPSGLTIMQELQAERRKREHEFRRHNPTGPQWPGFGPEPVSGMMRGRSDYLESLWDSHAAPTSNTGPVPGVVANPANTAAMLGRWGTIGQNLWPSNQLSQQQLLAGYTASTAGGCMPPTSIPPPSMISHQQLQQQVVAAVVNSQNGGSNMASGFGGVSGVSVGNMHSPPPAVHPQHMINSSPAAMYSANGSSNNATKQQNDMDPLSIANIWAKNNSGNSSGSNGLNGGNGGNQRQEAAPAVPVSNTWSAALFSNNKNKDL